MNPGIGGIEGSEGTEATATAAARTSSRFLGRVGDYEKARPGYPPEIVDWLVERGAFAPGSAVADVGSGTGLFTERLLAAGAVCFAVEPNAEMRAAAERRFAGEPNFRSVAGDAAATTLGDTAVDLVVAAQAFHWFDPAPTRAEWRRITRSPHRAALVWNSRRAGGTPFLERYERLLLDFGIDYANVGHRGVGEAKLAAFFRSPIEVLRVPNVQVLDRDGVRSRLLSSSYVPKPGAPRHDEMLAALDRLLAGTAVAGTVEMIYDTEVFLGELPGADA